MVHWDKEYKLPRTEMLGMPIPGAPDLSALSCWTEDGVLVAWLDSCSEVILPGQEADHPTEELILQQYIIRSDPPETESIPLRPLDIEIPDGVTALYDGVFQGKDLRSVRIPEGVTVIGNNAFLDCPYLERVILPSTLREIGDCAFAECSALRELRIPAGAVVGRDVFQNSPKLLDESGFLIQNHCVYAYAPKAPIQTLAIPEGVERIADWSGSAPWRRHVRSLQLPDSLQTLPSGIFHGFPALADENGLVIVRGTLYDYCGASTTVRIPETVRTISDEALWRCTANLQAEKPFHLREIFLPAGLSEVEFSAISPHDPGLTIFIPPEIGAEKLASLLENLASPDAPFAPAVAAPHIPPQGRFAQNLAIGFAVAYAGGQLGELELSPVYFAYFDDHFDLIDLETPHKQALLTLLREKVNW